MNQQFLSNTPYSQGCPPHVQPAPNNYNPGAVLPGQLIAQMSTMNIGPQPNSMSPNVGPNDLLAAPQAFSGTGQNDQNFQGAPNMMGQTQGEVKSNNMAPPLVNKMMPPNSMSHPGNASFPQRFPPVPQNSSAKSAVNGVPDGRYMQPPGHINGSPQASSRMGPQLGPLPAGPQQNSQMPSGLGHVQMPPGPGPIQKPPSLSHMQMPPGHGQMQMPTGLGQMPPGPGQIQMPPGQMQMPPGPGQMQMPPGPGQIPPGQMQMPSGPGQMQPGQMQMPSGPGQMQMSPGPGQVQMPPGPGHMQMPPGQMQMPPVPGQMQMPPGPGQIQMPPGPNQMQMPPSSGHMQMPPGSGHMQMPPGQMQMPAGPGHMQMPPGQMPPIPPGSQPFGTHQAGVPPKPGYPQHDPYQQAQQQGRRLDPDQMPSPIQVMQDDDRQRAGAFYTNQRGLVPPLVTTDFVTVDQGNASPSFVRATMYNVPTTIDMMKQTAVPFGLVISPLAEMKENEMPPPIEDMGELGPVRCVRCKAYMSPLMQFIDGGRRFFCLLCKAKTDVPAEYFQHLDHNGLRVDREQRAELSLGAYEFVATKDYCRNSTFPKPPALIFVIDVSYNNIKSGMVSLLCHEMKRILQNLPCDMGRPKSNMRVGFITYSNVVHFYNIKGTLAQPKMLVVGDINDMFMPLLDGFLCEPHEAEETITSLMEQIPLMFAETRETETILGPAIQAGLEALKASECAGKLLVFHSSLPIAEAPGKLKNREDRKLLGTDKEKTVLSPQNTFYNTLAQDCVAAGCSVDMFLFNNSYIDAATIGQISRLTGGQVYKYTYFRYDVDGARLVDDLLRNVRRNVAFDAIMRVRTSTGVRPVEFFGHFFMSNTTDMELASIDCDKAIAIEVKHDDKITEEEGVFIQVALLYTSCGGQRRLRILNLALKTCNQMSDLYRGCDLDTIVNYFSKRCMFKMLETSPKSVKDSLVNRCAQMLACYRKNCASPSSAGQLILPECMKLLPLYANCILKSDAVSGGSDITIDERNYLMYAVSTMDIPSSVVYFYPRLLPLHDIDLSSAELPAAIRCSSDKLRDDGVYLLENGIQMFLWVGANVSLDWSQNVFGDHLAAKIDIDRTSLPELDNPLSVRLRQIIARVRSQRQRSMKLTIIPQRDKLEVVFKHFLVEDRGIDGSASYVDFLCHMHKEIRNLLS